MGDGLSERKDEHVTLCVDENSQSRSNPFDRIHLPYRALPEIAHDAVDTSTTVFGKRIRQPLVIGPMTGGTRRGMRINEHLATAAEATAVALGVGSQRVAIAHPEAAAGFRRVRSLAPTIPLFANLGAVQLNYGMSVDEYVRAVEMIRADALYLHINPLQEAIQPGGDRDYSDLLAKIEALVGSCPVPVFAKEVGHGIDPQSARRLIEAGIAGIDVAGVGGTSYAWVESQRAGRPRTGAWFRDVGISTPEAIDAVACLREDVVIVASGGVRSPVDGLKARTLGAHLYSAARPFLLQALDSVDATVDLIQEWEDGLRTAMFVTGASTWSSVPAARAAQLGATEFG